MKLLTALILLLLIFRPSWAGLFGIGADRSENPWCTTPDCKDTGTPPAPPLPEPKPGGHNGCG